ncbi:MAG: NADH-quinone oxidoreductase subunit J, partial [Nitriliruptoraceae bacterium]
RADGAGEGQGRMGAQAEEEDARGRGGRVTGHEITFLLLAVLTGGAAVLTVTSRNLVHAALFLATTLAGIAGVFFALHADFLGLVQLVVYVGAVAVLFLFGLMLTRAPIGREALDSQNRGLGMAVSGVLFLVLAGLIVDAFGDAPRAAVTGPSIADVGVSLFASWVLPFELLSMLLLAALIGAILLARRESGESGDEAPFVQIALADPPPEDDSDGGEA